MGSVSDGARDISAPEPLRREHDLAAFDSGVPLLDDWLNRHAMRNQDSGASRTYVILRKGRVVGYYALASGAVAHDAATGRTRRKMPEPVPVMVLGRLAVARELQGVGLGRALLRDAVLRTMQAAEIAGIRAVLVHAISEDAKRFYERCGFRPSPLDRMALMITLRDAAQALVGDAD